MHRPSPIRLASVAAASLGAGAAWLALAVPALGHAGDVPPPPSSPLDVIIGGWSFEPTIQLPLALSALVYVWAFLHVNRAHPANPVPVRRLVAWLLGLAAIEIALQSAIDEYEGVLFTVHMVQHIILIFAAAPLLALGAPITLALRVATPRGRKRILLPVLHSRIVRALSFPVVAWLLFAGAMWGTHFSPIFDISLHDQTVHDLEHMLYMATAMLFWWPVVGLDPSPWRMPHPARLVYVFLQMPQNSFLGLAIYSATQPLYEGYANSGRTWGPSPLSDQQLAGGLMWVAGDLFFLVVVLLLVVAWARNEEREAIRVDAQLDGQLAAIHARELRLAERLAAEREADAREDAPADALEAVQRE